MHAVGNHPLPHASFNDSYPGREMAFALRDGDSIATRKRECQDGSERDSIHGLKDERAHESTDSDGRAGGACADPDCGPAEFGDR